MIIEIGISFKINKFLNINIKIKNAIICESNVRVTIVDYTIRKGFRRINKFLRIRIEAQTFSAPK